MQKLFRRRSYSDLFENDESKQKHFKFSYLIYFAITSAIGSGIFFTTGIASKTYAGMESLWSLH